ncbi:carbonic anhydrase 6 [Tachysurus ichikawai]
MELFSVIIHAVSLSFVLAGAGVHWTYKEGSLDQIHWPDEYPACGGRKQSPIDIKRRDVRFNPHMLQIEMTGYGEMKNGNFLMINNGHSG